MLPITDALLDALRDYRDAHGWTSLQLARHIGVSHGTLSRWLSGAINSVRKAAVFERVVSRLGIKSTAFEKGVVLDGEFRAKLVEGLQARKITGKVWREKWGQPCGVSYNTVTNWIAGASQSMRYDVYVRLCEVLGWDIGFRTPVPFAELPSAARNPAAITDQNTARRQEEPYDAWDDPAKKDPQIPQLPASLLTKVWIMDPEKYEKMTARMRAVSFEGKVRLYAREESKGPVQVTIVSGGALIADGEKIAVRDGSQLAVGRLHLVPVLVRSDTYYELQGPEEDDDAGEEDQG